MRVFSWIAAALVPALLACNTQAPSLLIPTFNRPQRVAFACFDLATNAKHRVWPIDACTPVDPDLPDAGAAGPERPITPTLHALVTQSDRGEVAAVDLIAPRTTVTVIDSRPDIPGTTFLASGELPGPIVVPAKHPQLTYVANAGSHDISVLRTEAFRSLQVGQSATVQRIRLQLADAPSSVAPFDMVLSPDEDALFVTAPASGLLLRVPLQRCDALSDEDKASCKEGEIDSEHIVSVPLNVSLSKAQAVVPAPGDEKEPYELICQPALVLPVPMAHTNAVPMPAPDTMPEPAGLAVDAFCKNDGSACQRRLLVADRRLPIIHVIDLDQLGSDAAEAAVIQPIVTGTATTRIVVTPRVPVAVDSEDETQYVYAIDATDGSVLAMHDGRVINVAPNRALRPDRIDFGPAAGTGTLVASSLGILTPQFDVTGPAAQWVEFKGSDKQDPLQTVDPGTGIERTPLYCTDTVYPTRSPLRLRGVFLAVGLTDGTVRFVDVHDMELSVCRDCDRSDVVMRDDAGEPEDPPAPAMAPQKPDPYPVVRNRTRVGIAYDPLVTTVVPARGPYVDPHFEVGSTIVSVNSNGTTLDSRIAGLDCVTCPATQSVSFPYDVTASLDAGTASGAGGDAAGEGGASGMRAGAGGSGGAGGGGAGGGDAGSVEASDAGSDTAGMPCSPGQGRVCSMQDPWLDPISWVAAYEGQIPGTRGGRGRFVEADNGDNRTGALEFAGEVHFCNVGVLGTDDIGEGRVGDQLQITAALPAEFAEKLKKDPALREDCEALVRGRDEEKTPIAFSIKQAYADRLVIDSNLLNRPRSLRRSADYALVRSCFLDMLIGFELHVRESYSIPFPGSTFLHRVVTDAASQRCKVDATLSPTRTSRAYEDELFDNGLLSFKVKAGKSPPAFGTLLALFSKSNVPKVVFDARYDASGAASGVTPVDLQFSPTNQMFYIVDVTARGLIPLSVNNITLSLTPYQ